MEWNFYVSFPEKEKERALAILEKEGIEHRPVDFLQDEFLTRLIRLFIEENPKRVQDIYEEYGNGRSYEKFLEAFTKDILMGAYFQKHLFPESDDIEGFVNSVIWGYKLANRIV